MPLLPVNLTLTKNRELSVIRDGISKVKQLGEKTLIFLNKKFGSTFHTHRKSREKAIYCDNFFQICRSIQA